MKLAGSCLQLDVGNSGSKWRLLEEGRVVARGTYRAADEASLAELLNCTPALQQIWVASVAGPEAESELAAVLAPPTEVQADARGLPEPLHNPMGVIAR